MSALYRRCRVSGPRSSRICQGRLGTQEIEELDEKIRTEIQEQADEWKSIEGLLANLKHSDEKAVIRMRYHDRESWGMVTRLMFGSKDDFVGKEDTYLRRVHKIHGSALLNMAKLLEDGDPNTAVPAAI